MDRLTIGVWNTEWRKPTSEAGKLIRQQLVEIQADILCICEGFEGLLPDDGYIVTSEADYGYPIKPGRRKVLLWSRNPWTEVDYIGSVSLPEGRFIRGKTLTLLGETTILGVCIPWADAHVSTGKRNRKKWEDHLTYLTGLAELLSTMSMRRLLVVGDFNQTMPQQRLPNIVSVRLQQVFST
ncbi:MAG: endonuclease/exonuclease/phosphatase family protein, partial [Anaerolineae bacterium]